MPDVEVTNDDIRPDDSLEAPSSQDGQTQVAKTPEPDASIQAQGDGEPDAQDGTHPLEPGGKRFNQVYARAKDAEFKLQSTREQLARLEGELEVLRKQPAQPAQPPAPPRYNATQLQAMVDEGKATLGQVLAYQEESLRLELDRKLESRLEEKLVTSQRISTVQRELGEYKHLMPEALQVGTPENTKLLNEFSYLVSLGYDAKDPRTEVLAARAAFGDINAVKERKAAKAIPTQRDTMQDITQNGKPKPDDKDPLKQLTAEQRKHYQRMIDRGVYKGWSEVKEELEYVPPR